MKADRRDELVRVDVTGTAHPVGRVASREMRSRQGAYRLLPAPPHVVVMRFAGRDGGDAEQALPFWIAGEISKPGALWDLVGMVGQGNWTGELVVVDGQATRSVFFERGHVVGAHSTADKERLGEVLYRYGALNREQVAAVADAVTPSLRFGQAAVALEMLSQDTLFHVIGRQTEEIVYAAFAATSGTFYFVEGYDASRLAYRQKLAVAALLMEGARRMDEMECFRARIPSSLHVPARAPGRRGVGPEHALHAVWEAVDGLRSIEDIGRHLGQGEFDTTHAIFQLLQAGELVVHPPRPEGPEAVVAIFNQTIALILAEVDKHQSGRDVRESLASFATAGGVYSALFQDAGPRPDGTLVPAVVAQNLARAVGIDGDGSLGQWLYEYASFAMFIAEPVLRAGGRSDVGAVARQVAELLRPLAPET
ncbi:MAG: DUF4388 domain-containing protein [Myxococcales bacterium]|nr:DUF4388 domain-containing protein [Myxococcales bacterium]